MAVKTTCRLLEVHRRTEGLEPAAGDRRSIGRWADRFDGVDEAPGAGPVGRVPERQRDRHDQQDGHQRRGSVSPGKLEDAVDHVRAV